MNDFYSYLNGEKATVAMDDKVGCELCPTEKVGKAGECKFEKGAEPEPGTGKDVAPIVGAAIGAAVSGAAEGAGNLMSAANGDKKPKCCVKDALAKYLACDETLEEHDKKYHPDGYKPGDACKLRETSEKVDDLGESKKEAKKEEPKGEEDFDAKISRYEKEMSEKNGKVKVNTQVEYDNVDRNDWGKARGGREPTNWTKEQLENFAKANPEFSGKEK